MTEPSESAKTTAIETDTPSTEDKNIKDANAVNSVENAEKTESTTHTGRGKAIAIAAVVLILIAGVGGYAYWTHFEAAAYHDSVVTAETADTKLTKTIDKATAVTYKADQLKEPKLLDQLDNAIKKAKGLRGVPDAQPNEWMAWQLVEAKDANAKDANEADAQAKALDNALKKVVDSKLAKELESAKTQLRQGVDGANKTFKDTDGKVADNATRDSLRKAIDEANAILNKKDVSDPKTYTDEKGKLDTAIKKVNDSKAAKENADAEAAAKAQAEAQAQAAAQAQSQSYNRGYSSNRGGNSNSSRGYSAPQQSYAPSDNTNSGSGSHRTFDFSNSGADGGSVGGDPYAPIVH